VRAIDGGVADLINRADVHGQHRGQQHGRRRGAADFGSRVAVRAGYFQVVLSPPEALAAGAGWRILQLTNTSYFADNSATYALPGATYTLTFRPATGFLAPSDRALQVVANQTAVLTINYTSLGLHAGSPVLSNGVANLTFTAPAGQRLALERSTNLVNWVPVVTNFVGGDGVIRFTDSGLLRSAFYRARLIP